MIIYKDHFTGDELFSDSSKLQLLYEGTVWKVTGKLRTDTFDIDSKAIGGNASAEGGEEGTEAATKQGVDIVMNSRLVEYTLSKKDYMTHIKEYMKSVKDYLTAEQPKEVEVFTKNIQNFVKDVLAGYKDYQLFCGESMGPEGMLALMRWEDVEDPETKSTTQVPHMYFFKHGLDAEKV